MNLCTSHADYGEINKDILRCVNASGKGVGSMQIVDKSNL